MPYLRSKNAVPEAEEDECYDYWDFLSIGQWFSRSILVDQNNKEQLYY